MHQLTGAAIEPEIGGLRPHRLLPMPPLHHAPPAVLAALAITAAAHRCEAQGCGEDGGNKVLLTAALGVGAGGIGALGISGILAAADPDGDFAFGIGAGVGVGVTTALSAIYWAIDGSTGCRMVQRSGSVAWSVPISMLLVGGLLPLAIWGASRQSDPATGDPPATGASTAAAPPVPIGGLTVQF